MIVVGFWHQSLSLLNEIELHNAILLCQRKSLHKNLQSYSHARGNLNLWNHKINRICWKNNEREIFALLKKDFELRGRTVTYSYIRVIVLRESGGVELKGLGSGIAGMFFSRSWLQYNWACIIKRAISELAPPLLHAKDSYTKLWKCLHIVMDVDTQVGREGINIQFTKWKTNIYTNWCLPSQIRLPARWR